MSIHVLIVDDQNLFALSLKTFIHNYTDDIRVVGIASNGVEALSCWEQFKPEIILMDVHMPEMNGVEATRELHKKCKDVKIIMLSTFDEDEYVRQALSYGASGYLMKDLSPTELIASIRAVSSGITQISPSLISNLIQSLHSDEDNNKSHHLKEQMEWVEKLSRREKEIFTLIATGYDNDQISEELCISERTVRNHVSIIYSKLNINNRFQIIQLANKIHYHI
ncbi:response regulator transcription factor [Oceanispirochaeta sp.]|jgi:DNA-binding NarL/FixJ family response regulator|uniref:response regulator transcription factor n=1 Tax=Oceanispirochaeta sp. TaxID=2035350 RepID=UPI00262400CA|nr:response regulator transcription factor [Oceanispirochaeta sp.]MDA3957211.1 response regulator transcription factor [Oceanispirochaeta sp.]